VSSYGNKQTKVSSEEEEEEEKEKGNGRYSFINYYYCSIYIK